MSTKPKPADPSLHLPPGSKLEEIKVRGPEDSEEKRLRLRKEFLSFLIKDLLAYLVAYALIIGIGVYCFVILARHGAVSEEAQKVWPILTTILAAVAGMIFGKAMKSG